MPKRQIDSPTPVETPIAGAHARGPWSKWCSFWFAPRDRIALDVVRMLLGLYLLFWLGSCLGHQRALFGINGWFDAEAYRRASLMPDDSHPPIGWSPAYMAGGAAGLDALYYGTLAIFGLFAAGIAVRVTAPLTWLGVVAFTTNPVLFYGGEAFLLIASLYLAVGYSCMGWRGKEEVLAPPLGLGAGNPNSSAANLGIRLLQVHLAIVVFVSALHKLQVGEWWAGDPYWFAWTDPAHFSFRDLMALRESQRARGLTIAFSFAAYVTLAWQFAFPFVVWRAGWRKVMLAGAVFGAVGCWWIYRLPVYGLGLVLSCLAFVEPTTWRALLARVVRMERGAPAGELASRDLAAVGTP